MTHETSGVHPQCPLQDANQIKLDAVYASQLSVQIFTDYGRQEVGDTANEADAVYQKISRDAKIPANGSNMFVPASSPQLWAANRRTSLRAINPEGSLFATVGLSAHALQTSLRLTRHSRAAHAVKISKTGALGILSIGVAGSQPLESLPGVSQARRMASKLSHRFS